MGTMKPLIDNKHFGFMLRYAGITTLADNTSSYVESSQTQSTTSYNTVIAVATTLAYQVQPPTWVYPSDPTNYYIVNERLDALVGSGRNVITVEAIDPNGNRDWDFSGAGKNVTLTPSGGPSISGGTNPVQATNGSATFGDLTFSPYGFAKVVTSNTNSLTNVTSNTFVVRADLPASPTQPSGSITQTSRNYLQVSWKPLRGSDAGVILVGRGPGSASQPALDINCGMPSNSTTTYTFNSNWANAGTLNPGSQKVLYIGSGSNTTVQNLTRNRAYGFTLYFYTGSYQTSPIDYTPCLNYSLPASISAVTATINSAFTSNKSISEIADVEVANFKAVLDKEGKVTLNWKTLTEMDNAGFELYRNSAADNNEYVLVGSYQNRTELQGLGVGNTTNGKNYNFVDVPEIQPNEVIIYKLVSIAFSDGNAETQGITNVLTDDGSLLTASEIRPNPVTNKIEFTLTLQANELVTIDVMDISGRTIAAPYTNMGFNSGENLINFGLGSNVPSGSYILRISNGKETLYRRFNYLP